jgi:hypothetical protein
MSRAIIVLFIFITSYVIAGVSSYPTSGGGGGGGSVTAGPSGAIIVTGGSEVDIDTAIVCRTTASCTPSGAQNFSGSSATRPTKEGASDPATCVEGEMFYNTTSKATKRCTATNTWTSIAGAVSQTDALVFGPVYVPLLVNGSQFAPTSNRVYCGNILPLSNITVGHMVAWQVIAIGAGDLRFGVYDSSGNLLSASGAATSSGNTLNTTISQTLTAGVTYSLCMATNDTTVRFVKMWQGQNEEALYNLNETNFFYCTNTMSGTTLPATCGTKTAINSGGFPWFGIAK